jgi:predicted GNAT family N-acyltransferase
MTNIHRITEAVSATPAHRSALPHADGEKISVRPLKDDEIDGALELTRRHPELAIGADEVLKRVHAHNRYTTWGIFVHQDGSDEPMLQGYYAFLLLNEAGDAKLRARTLKRSDPPNDMVAASDERPATIYIWSMVAKGVSVIATPMMIEALGKVCTGVPVYATAGTQSGLNFMRRRGFHALTPDDDSIGGLFQYQKAEAQAYTWPVPEQAPTPTPILESRYRIVVARTSDDVERALAVRAAVFMMEQHCPYEEEFDGNDRTCTHLIGLVDGEPAAAMRIRYFADFVKLERLAVLPRFRGMLIAKEIVEAAINFCRRKGYRKMYGHGQKRLVKFWARYGFHPVDKNYALVFSDHEYVEMFGDLEPHEDPITMHSDPHIFLRPEGRWDEPSILEKSAARPPTNPH